MSNQITRIYSLADPRTGEVRYVGKTSQSLKCRLYSHSGDKQDNHRTRWIGTLLAVGLRPIIALIEEVPFGDWEQRERFWIAEYLRRGARLTNGTIGGEGVLPWKGTPAQRAALKKGGEANRGREVSLETRQRLAESSRGRIIPREAVERSAQKRRGAKRSDDMRQKMAAAQAARPGYAPSVQTVCAGCSEPITVEANRYREHAPNLYCGKACFHAARDFRITTPCAWCGAPVQAQRSRIAKGRRVVCCHQHATMVRHHGERFARSAA